MMERATIRLERDDDPWVDRLRHYKVLIDGESVGRVGPGESRDFPVSPGRHQIVLKIDWAGSQTLTVDVRANGQVRLRCGPGVSRDALRSPWKVLPKLTTQRHTYISLEVVGA